MSACDAALTGTSLRRLRRAADRTRKAAKLHPPEPATRPALSAATAAAGGAGDWQLQLHRDARVGSRWQARATGPDGVHAFGSMAELVRWLVQLDSATGRGIR